MRSFHLILGIAMLSVGVLMLLMRERIPAYHENRKGHADIPVGVWVLLGGILALAGLGQIVLGV